MAWSVARCSSFERGFASLVPLLGAAAWSPERSVARVGCQRSPQPSTRRWKPARSRQWRCKARISRSASSGAPWALRAGPATSWGRVPGPCCCSACTKGRGRPKGKSQATTRPTVAPVEGVAAAPVALVAVWRAPGASTASSAARVGNSSTRSSFTTLPARRPQARVSGLRVLGAQLKSRPNSSVGSPASAGFKRSSRRSQHGRLTMEAVAISSSSSAIDTLPETA